jgi:hypothetical protein
MAPDRRAERRPDQVGDKAALVATALVFVWLLADMIGGLL